MAMNSKYRDSDSKRENSKLNTIHLILKKKKKNTRHQKKKPINKIRKE